jgi:hypothetical protein
MANSRLGVDACDLCGSTHFSVIDGIRYCENGHEQAVSIYQARPPTKLTGPPPPTTDSYVQGGQQIADDAEEYGTQGKRTIKKKDRSGVKIFKGICLPSPTISMLIVIKSTGARRPISCFSNLTSTSYGNSVTP